MGESGEQDVVSDSGVAVESRVIMLISPLVWLGASWRYFWIFKVALGVVIGVILFRVMAARAENPNVEIIRRSLRWSCLMLQLALIGALAAISEQIISYAGFLTPLTVFITLAVSVTLGFAFLDILIAGEYAKTWRRIIYEESDDGIVGQLLRRVADFGYEQIEAVLGESADFDSQNSLKAGMLALGVLVLLLLVSLPVWIVLAEFFSGWTAAVLVLIALVFIRDLARYIYIRYGAAQSFSDLRWTLKTEFVLTIAKGWVLAGVLGFNLPTFL